MAPVQGGLAAGTGALRSMTAEGVSHLQPTGLKDSSEPGATQTAFYRKQWGFCWLVCFLGHSIV